MLPFCGDLKICDSTLKGRLQPQRTPKCAKVNWMTQSFSIKDFKAHIPLRVCGNWNQLQMALPMGLLPIIAGRYNGWRVGGACVHKVVKAFYIFGSNSVLASTMWALCSSSCNLVFLKHGAEYCALAINEAVFQKGFQGAKVHRWAAEGEYKWFFTSSPITELVLGVEGGVQRDKDVDI